MQSVFFQCMHHTLAEVHSAWNASVIFNYFGIKCEIAVVIATAARFASHFICHRERSSERVRILDPVSSAEADGRIGFRVLKYLELFASVNSCKPAAEMSPQTVWFVSAIRSFVRRGGNVAFLIIIKDWTFVQGFKSKLEGTFIILFSCTFTSVKYKQIMHITAMIKCVSVIQSCSSES